MAAASYYSPIRCFSSASLNFADLQEYKEDTISKNKIYIVKCAFIQSGIYSCKYNELYGILLYVCYNNKELSP